MRKLGLLGASLMAVLALGGTLAGAASAKQVGLFEPVTGTQVSPSQELGTVMVLDWEGGGAQCHTTWAGDLEPWIPILEPPPLRTTVFYDHDPLSRECSSEAAGESVELRGGLLKIEVTGPTKAALIAGSRIHEQLAGAPVGEGYCSYDGPRRTPLRSVSGKDWTDWTGTALFKRVRIESDATCAQSFEVTVGVNGYAYGEEEPLETRRVS